MRREQDEWVEADERHEALTSDEQFEWAQAEMQRRSTGQSGNRRRRPQKRLYLLRGIVDCATGHNPLRMQGRSRRGEPTYYTCGFRASYGDRAAEAVGHGKWQYVREDSLTVLIDSFFATRIFGADRLAHFGRQRASITGELRDSDGDKRKRITSQIAELEQKIERQLAAIEAGVDPAEVGRRIRELKAERAKAQSVLAQIEDSRRDSTAVDPEDARAVLDALPDLGTHLAAADPTLRRAVFNAFRLHVEIDRNSGQIRLKALVSSAFGEATDLSDLGEAGDPALSDKAIPPAEHKTNWVPVPPSQRRPSTGLASSARRADPTFDVARRADQVVLSPAAFEDRWRDLIGACESPTQFCPPSIRDRGQRPA